jgi:AAA family ATP:ADP antiporter
MNNPLRQVLDIRRRELAVVLLLFLFFFLVIAVFQLLRPLKKGLFIEHYGAELELYAKLANILVAALAVAAFTFLYNRLSRQRLIYVLAAFFVLSFLILVQSLPGRGPGSVWGFYLLGDLVSTLWVACFWAYATDLVNTDQAKRLFGFVGGGGVVGGVAGISLAKFLLGALGTEALIALAAVMIAALAAITFGIEALLDRGAAFRRSAGPRPADPAKPAKSGWSVAVEGARLVLRSRYLAAIVGVMAFYEMASQVMDFQYSHLAEAFEGAGATQAFFANVGFYANSLAVVVQFVLVSLIMRKLGVTVALLVLPFAILGSSGAFLVMPTLMAASLLHISDNGLNYSIQQTARESLYVVTTPDEKYKARAFTNMFVQRLAKGLSIFLLMGLLALKVEANLMSLVTMVVAILMILFSLYAGREFTRKSRAEEPQREAA